MLRLKDKDWPSPIPMNQLHEGEIGYVLATGELVVRNSSNRLHMDGAFAIVGKSGSAKDASDGYDAACSSDVIVLSKGTELIVE